MNFQTLTFGMYLFLCHFCMLCSFLFYLKSLYCTSCLICTSVPQRWNTVNIDSPVPGGRKFHSAACITTDPGSPKLLVIGGSLPDRDVSGEIWMLDYNAMKWIKVYSRSGCLVPLTDPKLIITKELFACFAIWCIAIINFPFKVDTMLEMKRFWHTATCLVHTHDSTVIQVVGFGGSAENGFPLEPMSETIVIDLGELG